MNELFSVLVTDRTGKVIKSYEFSSYKAAKKQYRVSIQTAARNGGNVEIINQSGATV
jgi:helix-turn-helix protein